MADNKPAVPSAPPQPSASLTNWNEEALALIAKCYEDTIEQDSDRKKSAEQRAISILAGSAVALTLMFTATSITLNVKESFLEHVRQSLPLLIVMCLGLLFLILSNVFFVVAVWCAAHTLRPRAVMHYQPNSYYALPAPTTKAFLVDKIESLSKCTLQWDESASAVVEDLNRALSPFKLALGFLFLTTIALASAILVIVIPWLINSIVIN